MQIEYVALVACRETRSVAIWGKKWSNKYDDRVIHFAQCVALCCLRDTDLKFWVLGAMGG